MTVTGMASEEGGRGTGCVVKGSWACPCCSWHYPHLPCPPPHTYSWKRGSRPNAFVDANSSEACEAATLNQKEEGKGRGKSENESGQRGETRGKLDMSLEETLSVENLLWARHCAGAVDLSNV